MPDHVYDLGFHREWLVQLWPHTQSVSERVPSNDYPTAEKTEHWQQTEVLRHRSAYKLRVSCNKLLYASDLKGLHVESHV